VEHLIHQAQERNKTKDIYNIKQRPKAISP